MSEHLNNEELPTIRLRMENDRTFESTPLNTTLFNFVGYVALKETIVNADKFDHVFIQTGTEDEKVMLGTYVFRENPLTGEVNETYVAMAEFMVEMGYPLHINLRDVPECDQNAYLRLVEQEIAYEMNEMPDTLPEGWE